MIGFPLTTRSCDLVDSCGISTRFHVLSLYHRQVAHALLTRPPLTCPAASRRIKQDKSVRLECVRHAASVHPEPGSNSRNLSIYKPFLAYISLIPSSFCSFLLFRVSTLGIASPCTSSINLSLPCTFVLLSLSYISVCVLFNFQ